VRRGDGNIPTYLAFRAAQRRKGVEGGLVSDRRKVAEEGEASGCMKGRDPFEGRGSGTRGLALRAMPVCHKIFPLFSSSATTLPDEEQQG
jgi:hypothetical protein